MTPVRKLYLTIFLTMGLFFGTLMTLLELMLGIGFHLWKFIFYVLFYGGFMSLILTKLHIRELQKLGITDLTDEKLSPFKEETIATSLNKESLISRLKNSGRMGIIEEKEGKTIIHLISKMSMESWGEELFIELPNDYNKEQKVRVVSRPKISTTKVDFGKNTKNIMDVKELILG